MNYSPSCCSKLIRPLFIFGTQIETFLEKIIKILKRFMAQKGSKDIVKIVHVTVFQLQFYEAT